MKHVLTLSISHNIYLTKEERYALESTSPVSAVGVSIPVWFYKGNTSEPALEVFCKYLLTNIKQDSPIIRMRDGYKINIPQLPPEYEETEKLTNEQWRNMSEEEKDVWYHENELPMCGKNLLDPVDGGGSYLCFSQYKKVKKNDKLLDIVHHIEIKKIEELENSMII